MKYRAVFTRQLHSYLIEQGYTHIYSLGIRPKPGEIEDGEDYILIPLKPDDPRLSYQETNMHIDLINNIDILEMTGRDEFITFYVEIPMEDYDNYYQKNK